MISFRNATVFWSSSHNMDMPGFQTAWLTTIPLFWLGGKCLHSPNKCWQPVEMDEKDAQGVGTVSSTPRGVWSSLHSCCSLWSPHGKRRDHRCHLCGKKRCWMASGSGCGGWKIPPRALINSWTKFWRISYLAEWLRFAIWGLSNILCPIPAIVQPALLQLLHLRHLLRSLSPHWQSFSGHTTHVLLGSK